MANIASIALPVTAGAQQSANIAIPPAAAAAAPAPEPSHAGPVQSGASAPPPTAEALQQQLDMALAEADTSLRFRVDPEAGRVVVSVLDHRGDVLMQIPDEAALAVARHLAATGSLLDARA